jgi:hypothetical protein
MTIEQTPAATAMDLYCKSLSNNQLNEALVIQQSTITASIEDRIILRAIENEIHRRKQEVFA